MIKMMSSKKMRNHESTQMKQIRTHKCKSYLVPKEKEDKA